MGKSSGHRLSGSCLCGGVRFRIERPPKDILYCHCSQCRKTTGHFLPAIQVQNPDLVMEAEETLQWYQSSPKARRAFCSTCGSTLFWHADGESHTSVAAGTIDGETGLGVRGHIFTDDKGDYYTIPGHELEG